MGHPFGTWVASDLDVATKKDDHFPTVAELLWQPLPPCRPVSWNTPCMSRASSKDEAASAHFRHWLSLVPVPPVCTPVETHRAYVVSVLQEAGALFFPVQRKEAKKGWIQESTWHMMSLVQAWRKVRFAERAWWNKVLLCILWQGWSSRLVVYMDRDALSSEISGLVALMHRRLAIIERTIDIILDNKNKLVRYDRRQASNAILVDAAQRSERGDDKGFYEKLSLLRPWKARPLPMLKKRMAPLRGRRRRLHPDGSSTFPLRWAVFHHPLMSLLWLP